MNIRAIINLLLMGMLHIATSCSEEQVPAINALDCQLSGIPSNTHPKVDEFQAIIEKYGDEGIAGQSLMIQDPQGVWLGTAGKADIASDTDMRACHKMIIASCSKTFTATIIFLLVEEGKLALTDKLSDYLPESLIGEVANTSQANLEQILSHTSGILDYYTPEFELARLNTFHNDFSQEDILSYTFGKKADTSPGEEYIYSNTNYLLLGLLLEEVEQQPLAQIFEERLFTPLGLSSSSFASDVPVDLASGYFPYNGQALYEAERLYGDELGTADGGIVSTAYDMGRFITLLAEGGIVNDQSLQKMTAWFDIPTEEGDEDGGKLVGNGFGLELYETKQGFAYGHTGAVDGFYSIMLYFPQQKATFVYAINGGTNFDAWLDSVDELRETLFRQ